MELKNRDHEDKQGDFLAVADRIASIASVFYSRGWLLGTSGNLSAVVSKDPLRIAITGSGLHKGNLDASDIIEIDGDGNIISGEQKVSSETALHLAVIRVLHAGSVFHTHSVWSTILSRKYLKDGGIVLEGYEMLKGLENVSTHSHREWLPILENSQDMTSLSLMVSDILGKYPDVHGFLLAGHGLYTWGKTAGDAERQVEVLEFLLEVFARSDPGTANIQGKHELP